MEWWRGVRAEGKENKISPLKTQTGAEENED